MGAQISDLPQFPLTVHWASGESESFEDTADLECNLEFFDSESEPEIKVVDNQGRLVALKIEALEVIQLQLKAGGK